MPLQADEVVVLVPELNDLRQALDHALRKDKDGKVRLTKKEAQHIGKLCVNLGWKLIRDILD